MELPRSAAAPAVQARSIQDRAPAPAPASGEGERRQLTVLFCDLVGFTELATRLDPELLQGVVRGYEDACAVGITRYDGYVFQRLGDGIVAFFGYPLAHEGEAERAIRAGLEILEALPTLDLPAAGSPAGAHRDRHRRGGRRTGREERDRRHHEPRRICGLVIWSRRDGMVITSRLCTIPSELTS